MIKSRDRLANLVESLNKALPSSVIARLERDRVLIASRLNGKKVWLNGKLRIVGEAG